jgi:PAS domain S-box-containing protein
MHSLGRRTEVSDRQAVAEMEIGRSSDDLDRSRNLQRALELAEQKFRRGFQHAPVTMTVSTAKENRLIDVNDTWVRLMGYSRDEALGRTPIELGLLLDPGDFDRINAQIAAAGAVYGFECRLRTRDGRIVVGLVSGEEFEVDGETLRIVAIVDITRQREAETIAAKKTAELAHAQETERRRIGQELHDDIAQQLVVLQMNVSMLERDCPEDLREMRDRLHDISVQAKKVASDVRALSHVLHPVGGSNEPIEGRLRTICGEFSRGTEATIDFLCWNLPPDGVPREVSACFQGVLKEALANAVTHGHATWIRVECWAGGGRVYLRVEDFGTGFDPAAHEQSSIGLGLVAMKERVSALGGFFSSRSTKGQGSQISVGIPISRENE